MNLEQSKLTVNGTFNSNGGLLWEKAICSQGCQCIDYEILDASVPQALTHMLQVEMLQATIARTMEQNHDNHYLSLRQCRIPVIFALILGLYRVFFHLRIKNFAEIICHTINFSNFVLGDYSDFCLYFFVFRHYKRYNKFR